MRDSARGGWGDGGARGGGARGADGVKKQKRGEARFGRARVIDVKDVRL